MNKKEKINEIFSSDFVLNDNLIFFETASVHQNQQQTNEVFSEKWDKFENNESRDKLYDFQKKWYLKLYGFESENSLKNYLEKCSFIYDAGCGLGYKAAWFATLSPNSIVLGMDYSSSVLHAAKNYRHLKNLFFIQGDISRTNFKNNSMDFVSCDQVIMHTENPELTFSELSRICSKDKGELACYFYAKKALPRECLDNYFRMECKNLSNEELWNMSKQLTALGQSLSKLNIRIDVPDIPALGIHGGNYDLQRFLYWNFFKCFWNEDLGEETSVSVNFDWYSPSNARRFSESEVLELVKQNSLVSVFFHKEEACYSGRFKNVDGS